MNKRLRPLRNRLFAQFFVGGLLLGSVILFFAPTVWPVLFVWAAYFGLRILAIRCENCGLRVHFVTYRRFEWPTLFVGTGFMPRRCPRCDVKIP